MKFIDLFAGLGGFHIGLSRLGHECVYACEIDEQLNELYRMNFPKTPIVDFDIAKVDPNKLPHYDILCAGFPCQPFSQAGPQTGFDHKIAGNMFHQILRFIKCNNPKYLFLENVPNLKNHNKGKTWMSMKKILEKDLEYIIQEEFISPLHFNIPQTRKRFYILGTRLKKEIRWPIFFTKELNGKKITNLKKWFIKKPHKPRKLTREKKYVVKMWEEFLQSIPDKKNLESIYSPLWTAEFGATYPFEEKAPTAISKKELSRYRGIRGKKLSTVNLKDVVDHLPPYAQYSRSRNESKEESKQFPEWKKTFIRNNRKFYRKNKKWIDPWIKKYSNPKFSIALEATHRKFEWNCFGEKFTLKDKVLSFRGSGLRVKRMDAAPTLVSTTLTQLPYIPLLKRYLSVEECLKIQGLNKITKNMVNRGWEKTYAAIGNAVNADVVKFIAEAFLSKNKTNIEYRVLPKNYRLKYGRKLKS